MNIKIIVPRLATDESELSVQTLNNLNGLGQVAREFFGRIVIEDETVLNQYSPKIKSQLRWWQPRRGASGPAKM